MSHQLDSAAAMSTDLDSKILEKQFIVNFDRRCTMLLSEEERDALYSALGDYRTTGQLNPLLDKLSYVLNSPIKMDLVSDVRHFIEERHFAQFDQGMPFGDLGSKVINILSGTPCHSRQKSLASTPRSLTPRPAIDVTRNDPKSESRRCELIRMDKEPLGFSLRGAPDRGVFIKNVVPHSIADSSGLKAGDRLLDINDIPLHSFTLQQIADLIESMNVLRILVLRSKRPTIPKNSVGGSATPWGTEEKRIPNRSAVVGSGRSNTEITSSFPHNFPDGYRDREANQHRPGMSSSTNIHRVVPIERRHQRSTNQHTTDQSTTVARAPHTRTKTVIELSGTGTPNRSDKIRIEELSESEGNKPIVYTRPYWSSSPNILSSNLALAPSKPLRQKSQSLPSPRNSFASSPHSKNYSRDVPLIRSYAPSRNDYMTGSNSLPIHQQHRTFLQHSNQQISTIGQHQQIFAEQINPQSLQSLQPQNYQHRSQQVPYLREEILQQPVYDFSQQLRRFPPQNYGRDSVPVIPSPHGAFERHHNPVFPVVIPHYQSTPLIQTVDGDYAYLDPHFSQPGRWRSMENMSYRSISAESDPNRRRKKRFRSNPDLTEDTNNSEWNYFVRSPNSREVDAYSLDREKTSLHKFRNGWKSEEDNDYEAPSCYEHQSDSKYVVRSLKAAKNLQRNRNSEDTASEHSDFENISRDFDTSSGSRINRMATKESRRFDEYEKQYRFRDKKASRPSRPNDDDAFLNSSPTTKSRVPLYQSSTSREVLFKKIDSRDPGKLQIPIEREEIPPYISERLSPQRPLKSRSDLEKVEGGKFQSTNPLKKPPRSGKSHNSNISNRDAKDSVTERSRTTSKSINKSPKAQPRSRGQTPTHSSLSSNVSLGDTSNKYSTNLHQMTARGDRETKGEAKGSTSYDLRSTSKDGDKSNAVDLTGHSKRNMEAADVNLLGYSKLASPALSFRSRADKTNQPIYQNVNFLGDSKKSSSRETVQSGSAADSASTISRSDSQSSLTSVKTLKSGQYDFVEASSEFNKQQPHHEKFTYTEKSFVSNPPTQLQSAREKIFGKEWAEKSKATKAPTASKISTTSRLKTKEDGSWITNTAMDKENNNTENGSRESGKDALKKENLNNEPLSEAKHKSDSFEGWQGAGIDWTSLGDKKHFRNDEKSGTADSADSGVSVDITVSSTPVKSPNKAPPLHPKPNVNRTYEVYRLQVPDSPFHSPGFDKKTPKQQSTQTAGLPSSVGRDEPDSSSDVWRYDPATKWRPVAQQRTFTERQNDLSYFDDRDEKKRMIKIKLDKTFPFLGLSISGGAESHIRPDIVIDNITKGSASDVEGSLKPGMKIISIDGRSLVGVRHSEAVHIIKSSFMDKSRRWMDVEASDRD